MSNIVKTVQTGEISFGVPGDIEVLNKPFGYYEFLGIQKDASEEDIKGAYRKLSLKFHPDKGGKREDFVSLQKVYEILTDDGGKLGIEHGSRNHYDRISGLDSFFDGFISHKDDRTRKLSEIMLTRLRSERESAEFTSELEEQSPKFKELKEKLERVRSEESARKIITQMREVEAEIKGLTADDLKELEELKKKSIEDHSKKLGEFVRDFRDNQESYLSKIADIFHIGGGTVNFSSTAAGAIYFVHHEDRKYVLELVIAKDCTLLGFSKVHFKSEKANITITDPNLEGIFHIIKGGINVIYEKSSYGNVIRARAKKVNLTGGFEQKGDLYVPSSFASQNWWNKKPSLDLAVLNGSISLKLESPEIADKYRHYDLDNIINNMYNSFKKEYIIKNDKY